MGLGAVVLAFALAVSSPASVPSADVAACRNANLKATRVEACTRLIAADTTKGEALAALYELRAGAHGDIQDYAAQAADLGMAMRMRPPSADALLKRGAAYFRSGDSEAALADFNAAVVMSPNDPASRLWRGRVYRKLEQFANAEDDLDLAVGLDPKNPNAWMVRGLLLDDRKRHLEAIADYDRAVALAPGNLAPVYNRAWAKVQIGNHAGALADLETCRRIDPDDADCYELKGQALAAVKDFKGASHAYAQAIARASGEPRLRRSRAAALRETGDFDGAIAELTAALELDADMQTLYDRGWVYALSGRPDNAIADYSLILRREGADAWPSALVERGLARLVRGDLTAAADDFSNARAVAPADTRSALWRAVLGIRLNRDSVWASWRRSDVLETLKRERQRLKPSRFEAPFVQALLGERDLAEAHRVAQLAARQAEDPAEAACFADAMAGALALAGGDAKAAEGYYAKAAARNYPMSYSCMIATAELNRLRNR